MSLCAVKEYFARFGQAERIREFPVSSATVAEAAAALCCQPERIAKTLSFLQEDGPVLIVAAGDARIDNAAYKKKFGLKAKMLSPDTVEKLIGHGVGGVCPFAVKQGVKIYLDCSLRRFKTVFPACGSANSAIELSIPELEKYSGSLGWIDVCKDWQSSELVLGNIEKTEE